MKSKGFQKINALLFFILIMSTVNGQITIKSNDMPSSGKNYYYSGTTAKINTDSVGKQDWDFSNITPNLSDTAKYNTVGFSPITYATFYGNLQLKTLTFGQQGSNFYNPKTAAFIQTGVGLKITTIDAPIKYSRVDTVYKFPLDYKNTFSDSFSGSFNVAINIKIAGQRNYEVDGYGTIKTPYGKFDVIRVKTILKSSYTITVAGFGFPVKFNTTEYRWLAKGQPFPIMQVIDNGILKTVTYADSARNIIDTNAIKPNFVANDSNVFVDDTVSFTNLSLKTTQATPYNWSVSPGVAGTDYQFVTGFGGNSKNPKIIFLVSGKYSITLSAGGFFGFGGVTKTKTDYINVKLPNLPEADFIASATSIAPGKRVVLMDKSLNKPRKWKWDITPSTYFFIESTDTFSKNPVISFSNEGKYSVKLIATNAAGNSSASKSDYINVDKTVGIENKTLNPASVHLFPNPNNGSFNLQIDNFAAIKNLSITIIDNLGKVVLFQNLNNVAPTIPLNLISNGIFTLKLEFRGETLYKKLIIN